MPPKHVYSSDELIPRDVVLLQIVKDKNPFTAGTGQRGAAWTAVAEAFASYLASEDGTRRPPVSATLQNRVNMMLRKYGRAHVWDRDRAQYIEAELLLKDPATSDLGQVDLCARPEDPRLVLLSVRALVHSIEVDFCKRQTNSPSVTRLLLTKPKSEGASTPPIREHERREQRDKERTPASSSAKTRERSDRHREREHLGRQVSLDRRNGLGINTEADDEGSSVVEHGRHDPASSSNRYVSSRSTATADDAAECEALLAHVVGKKRKLDTSLDSDSSSFDGSRSSSANSSPWMSPLNHYTTPQSVGVSVATRSSAASTTEPLRKRQSLHELVDLLGDESSSIDKITAQMQVAHENKLKLEREKLEFQRSVMQEHLRIAEAKLQLRREEAEERRKEREQRIKERELELQVEQTKLEQLRIQLELQRHAPAAAATQQQQQQQQQPQASNT